MFMICNPLHKKNDVSRSTPCEESA